MIHPTAVIGKNVTIKEEVIIGKNVIIEDDVYIDYGCIIRDNTRIKNGSLIGARSILGEYLMDFHSDKTNKVHPLVIGENAVIRSANVIYGDTVIGDNFESGHEVTIRENSIIGNSVKIGTHADIQHHCCIGNYVSIQSNCFIGEESIIKDYVQIHPWVVLTNDPTPPSNELIGVTIDCNAVIGSKSIILPGIHIFESAHVGAGSVVTKDVMQEAIIFGNPAKEI